MKILIGFNDKEIISEIKNILDSQNINAQFCVCTTKLDVYYYVLNDEKINAIILTEYIANDGKWSAYELAKLNDYRDLNIIPILQENKKGTEYIKILYAANITSAILGDAKPENICDLLTQRRTRKEAKKYYELKEIPLINFDEVTGNYLEFLLSKLENAEEKDVANIFDDICSQLSRKQVENFLTKLDSELLYHVKKSKTYAALKNNKKSKEKTGDTIKQKFVSRKLPMVNMLYGFDSESILKKIEDKIMSDGFLISSSLVRYNKEGIKNAINTTKTDSVVVTENLEKRGPYKAEELLELKQLKDVHLIPMLRGNDKLSSKYINRLYCEGITEAIIGPGSYEDIVNLVENKRTRRYAREYYGLDMEPIYVPSICNKYLNYIISFFRYGNAGLNDKVDFLKELLTDEQYNNVEKRLPEDIYQKLLDEELIKSKRLKKKKKKSPDTKIKKDIINKEKTKQSFKPGKKFFGMIIGILVLLMFLLLMNSIKNTKNTVQSNTTHIKSTVMRNVEPISYETTVPETTVIETTSEESTTQEVTIEETTTKKIKKKSGKKVKATKKIETTKASVNHNYNYSTSKKIESVPSTTKKIPQTKEKEKLKKWDSGNERLE